MFSRCTVGSDYSFGSGWTGLSQHIWALQFFSILGLWLLFLSHSCVGLVLCLSSSVLLETFSPRLQISCRVNQVFLQDSHVFYFILKPAAGKHPHDSATIMLHSGNDTFTLMCSVWWFSVWWPKSFRSRQTREPSSSWLQSLSRRISWWPPLLVFFLHSQSVFLNLPQADFPAVPSLFIMIELPVFQGMFSDGKFPRIHPLTCAFPSSLIFIVWKTQLKIHLHLTNYETSDVPVSI